MSVLEASAMEIPVLVSHSHGCEDSIVEKMTGEYIELSASDICQSIIKILNSRNLKKYGENGRRWVMENYERVKLWPLISDYYTQLVEH